MRKIVPIIINPGGISNHSLHSMYKRNNKIFDMNPEDKFINKLVLKMIYSLNYVGYKNFILLENHLYLDSNWIWNQLSSTLHFDKEELQEGEKLLTAMGIAKNDKFVVVHLREAHYYQNYVDLKRNPEASSNYNSRNPDIRKYKKAIEFLIKNNYKVIKTGFPGSKCDLSLDGFIDYANNFRTEFGDIFLHAKAAFVISGAAGNFQLASVFGTPSILTNSYDFQVKPLLNFDMYLPLTYQDNLTGELLPISLMLNEGTELSSKSSLEQRNISIIHNSKEEILMAVQEMHENIINLNLTNPLSQNEKKLNALFQPHHVGYKLSSRISQFWLNKYKHLLK